MAPRMTNAPMPPAAHSPESDDNPTAPTVRVLVTAVKGADLDAALSTVRRQVYQPVPDIVVVGADPETLLDGAKHAESLVAAIADPGSDTDFLWILHSDARPRPDALSALVSEVERNDASLGGSKLLVAGSHEELESVGSATDVFGEPYSGLDAGEIDLQQYDVVREVAFVRSASMLVRRDLAQGLRGLDELLPPIAAGLDFSQRTRLAGGRVISVPSSEVYHQGRCNERGRGWREQAGRLRSMLTAYSPLTLLWVVPYDMVVSFVDSVANLLLLRWRPAARHLRSWAWNLLHLPSTLRQRRLLRPVRATGDEELFRFQAKGSVRLREIGAELSVRLLSMFDDDQALARGSRRVRTSPGVWGAVLAGLLVVVSVRGIIFGGVPNVGMSFPFEPPTTALERWFAGWNQSGLGSPHAVHPSTGLTGLISWLLLGSEGATRTLMTIGLGFGAVVGMGRLGGRLGLRGPGRYLSGLVLIAGPGTALLVGRGSWLALAGAASLPWATRAVFVHPNAKAKSWLALLGWAIVLAIPLAFFSPGLLVVPLGVVVLWKVWGGEGGRLILALVALLAAVIALPFVLGDPGWLMDSERRLGLIAEESWVLLIVLAALPMVFVNSRLSRVATIGAITSLAGLIVVRLPTGGAAFEEGSLILASFGAAIVVSSGLDVLTTEPKRLVAGLASLAILVLSIGDLADGRLGLPAGNVNERVAFAQTLTDELGPGRILMASTVRSDIPGEARSGPGFWYRVIDGEGMTADQILLPEERSGDLSLAAALDRIASGEELRPGQQLAPFAIDWVILDGPPFVLDDVLLAQIDLVPIPLDPESRVYENPDAQSLVDGGSEGAWSRSGAGFAGESGSGRVSLALNYSDGWGPESGAVEWATSVSASSGKANFAGSDLNRYLAMAALGLLIASLVLIGIGRSRK